MKKSIIILSATAMTALISFKPGNIIWKYDDAHAKLGFSISHMMISDVEGSFRDVDATITSSNPDFSDAVVEMTARVNSVDTDNEQRDKHLLTPEFFDVAKYPVIAFKSISFTRKSHNVYTVKGNLTMHGITKPVTLTATAKTGINPMNQKAVTGFKVTGTLNRKDFGIAENTSSAMVGEQVEIQANAEFIRE